MTVSREALVTWTMRVLAPLCVLLAVVGAVRHYTPVPHWDMWPGYIDFDVRLAEGHWEDWWALHNEHRIVLARILFWIDHTLFGGRVAFLVAVNYLLVLASFFTFRAILRERAGPGAPRIPVQVATLFVLLVLFSWMQKENLVWGFQSQFFLAQWLPLLALYLLYRSTQGAVTARRDFALACLVGVLCIGTMASGVIALPLLAVYAACLRMGRRRVGLLVALSAVCLFAYFFDYRSTPGHGNLRDAITQQPVQLVQYVMLYLGSPWHHLFKGRAAGLGQVAGLVLVALAGWRARTCLRAPREHALELALLAFILYVGGTALGTGGGRLIFGLGQATAERYTTPALMAWIALMLLYLPELLRALALWRHRIVWPLLAVVLMLTVLQRDATRSQRPLLFEREVAAVAMELGVLDGEQLKFTVFSANVGLEIADRAVPREVAVFSLPWLRGVRATLGQPAGVLPQAACQGAITQLEPLPGGPKFRRITGWIAPAQGGNGIRTLRIVDPAGAVAGYAIAGERMKDALPRRGNVAGTRAFKGYVLTRAAHGPLVVAPGESACTLRVEGTPAPPFELLPPEIALASVNLKRDAVLRNDGWTGTDGHRSRAPGFLTLGTYRRGDQDTGTIVLRLRRGDTFVLRTGPDATRQRFQVDDGRQFAGTLPRVEQGAALVFDNPLLPDQFTLTLTDAGDGWGEWSSIALLDQP